MTKPTVLITSPVHPDAEAILTPVAEIVIAPDPGADTLRAMVKEADGLIVRNQLPADIFDDAPRLRGVVRHGVGLDFIPVDAATERGIAVANLPGSNTQAVAEYVFSALFHLRRPLGAMDARHRSEGWNAARAMTGAMPEIGGTTLGILGVGNIGRLVARIGLGFGMDVIGTSRSGRVPDDVTSVVIEELFASSDAVVIACSLTEETRGLVNARLIAAMKPTAVLINISRGAVIETAALVEALKEGRIGGAAVDVYEHQPVAKDDPLFSCPNLLMTPHSAALTTTSNRGMGVGAAEEMVRILAGEPPRNFVNPASRDVRARIAS